MAIDRLPEIENKVDRVLAAVGAASATVGGSTMLSRIQRVEEAIFGGAGVGLIIGSAAIANVLQSTNFVEGVSGWRILKSGDVEFQSGVFRGDITADSGFFSGVVYVGAEVGNRIVIDGDIAGLAGIYSETYVLGSSGFLFDSSGKAEFNDITARGEIYATTGNINGVFYVGNAGQRIIIDGDNNNIRSENYVANTSGWKITNTGVAEFQDVIARGAINSSVFTYNEVNATAGRQIVAPSAGVLLSDVTTVASPTTFNVDIKDPDSGHVQLFNSGDRLRITVAGTTNWLTISSVSNQTTFYRYVCTLSNGSASTFRAGTAVIDYGQSGDGLIISDAQSATGPYIQVVTHTGSPWITTTERVRIGNLNGWGSFVADTFGFALGDFSGGSYMYFDPTVPNTKIVNGAGAVTIDKDGIQISEGPFDNNRIRWVDSDTSSLIQITGNVSGSPGSKMATIGLIADNSPNGTNEQGASVSLQALGAYNPGTGLLNSVSLALTAFDSGFMDDPVAALGVYSTPAGGASSGTTFSLRKSTNWGLQLQGGVKIAAFATVNPAIPADGKLQFTAGGAINEFSTDGTLAGDSDDAVPTEKAVKTYVDGLTAPGGDSYSLWNRLVNYNQTPMEHWPNGADQLSWSWAGYTGFANPPSTIARPASSLSFFHNATARKFYYRAFISAQTQIICRAAVETNGQAGLMVDDGSGTGNADGLGANNFIRWFIEAGASGNWNFAMERRTGGGAVTKTTFGSVPAGAYYGMALIYGIGTRWTNWSCTVYLIGESSLNGYVSQSSVAGQTWTPTRHGLYGGPTTNTRSVFDWYTEI